MESVQRDYADAITSLPLYKINREYGRICDLGAMTKILVLVLTVLASLGMVSMPEGTCPKCGLHYHGWALRNPRHQTCPKCGRGLKIRDSNGTIVKSCSPLDAEGYLPDRPGSVTQPDNKAKDR
jgi:hypothetical protein